MRTCVDCGSKVPWQVVHNGETRGLGPRKRCLDCLPYKPAKRGKDRGWKTCQRCGERFETRPRVDGRVVKCDARIHCFDCTPLGSQIQSSKRPLSGERPCKRCEQNFPLSEYFRPSRKGGKDPILGYTSCKQCRADEQRENKRALKKAAVEYKGGTCEMCGYSRCLDALSFHHVDPLQKDFEVSRVHLRKNALERIRPELDKCRLLCVRCHVEEHARIRGTPSAEEDDQAPS